MAYLRNGPGTAAFTDEEVVKYRQMKADNAITVEEIADAHGMSMESVRRMLRRETYRHIAQQKPIDKMVESLGGPVAMFYGMHHNLPPDQRDAWRRENKQWLVANGKWQPEWDDPEQGTGGLDKLNDIISKSANSLVKELMDEPKMPDPGYSD